MCEIEVSVAGEERRETALTPKGCVRERERWQAKPSHQPATASKRAVSPGTSTEYREREREI